MPGDRRRFLEALGVGAAAGALLLPATARSTEPSGELGAYAPFAAPVRSTPVHFNVGDTSKGLPIPPPEPPTEPRPTEDNILGPYHRRGAPFRAKITPPLSPGEALVIRGRVWGADTRRPLSGAVLDVWQADSAGRYDNDDSRNPPAANLFVNRARLITDESGYYEYETIKPGRYQIGRDQWRPAHIHYWVTAGGYKPLVTQLYFEGDPYNDSDQFIRKSLIIKLEEMQIVQAKALLGTFDIVLAKA